MSDRIRAAVRRLAEIAWSCCGQEWPDHYAVCQRCGNSGR